MLSSTSTSHHSGRDKDSSHPSRSHRHRSRSRSRTRTRDHDDEKHRRDKPHDRSRSRSRDRKRRRHPRSESPRKRDLKVAKELPYNAKHISKHDYDGYKDLFASFLYVQKEIDFDEIDERERKGRFKQFVKKWNAGELTMGWYDPIRRKRAIEIRKEVLDEGKEDEQTPAQDGNGAGKDESDSDGDTFGPHFPGQMRLKAKVTLPTSDDLAMQKELEYEAHMEARAGLAFDRKLDRKKQKEALEELVPRAEAGTRERQLEKKRETNDKMRAFREKSPGAELELDEGTLMGGSDSFKQKKAQLERKKNERELRKEAMLRQRMQEREERLEEVKKREEKTMALLFAMRDTMFAKNRAQHE